MAHDDLHQTGGLAMNRRGSDRIPVDLQVTCRVPASPERARVADVSHGGCRVAFEGGGITPGSTVNLDLPSRTVSGQVMWTLGRSAGIRFHRRLSPEAAVALGLEQAAPPEPEPVEDLRPASGLRHWIGRVLGLR